MGIRNAFKTPQPSFSSPGAQSPGILDDFAVRKVSEAQEINFQKSNSTTMITNLNADMLDGSHKAAFVLSGAELWTLSGTNIYRNSKVGIGVDPISTLNFGAANSTATINRDLSKYQIGLDAYALATNYHSNSIAWANNGLASTSAVLCAINAVDEGTSYATGLSFATGNQGSFAERLRIDYLGNLNWKNSGGYAVGIFGILGNSYGYMQLNDATGNAQVQIRTDSGATTIFNELGLNTDFRIEGDTNAELFHLDASADKIGIGTAQPTSLLHVSGGNIACSGSVSGSSLIAGNGVTAYIVTAPLTILGVSGSMTFTSGILTAQTQAT